MIDEPLRYTFRTKPYSHQLRALEKIRRLDGRAGLFMPMRTGKTKTVIDWASIGYYNHDIRRVLVVCPISVIDVWKDEIHKHSPVPEGAIHVSTLRQSAKLNAEAVKSWVEALDKDDYVLHFIIVNYEMVWRSVPEVGPRGGVKMRHLDEVIADWQPDLVIADEAHKLKNPNSQQSKALARLAGASRMRLALTGTPIAKAPLDLFGLFRFVDPAIFPAKWSDFKDTYADWQPARYEPRIKEVVRYKNLEDLTDKTRSHSFRMTLRDAFPELTEPSVTNIRTPLGPKARKVYDDMAKEMIAELESGQIATAKIVLDKAMRLRQIASGFVKDENGEEVDVDDTKLRMLTDLVGTVVEQDEKLIIFCCFKHDYHSIHNALKTQGVTHAMYTGEQSDKTKEGAKRAFQTDPSVPVIVCQVQSGSLGIDLSAARLSAFFNLSYNWVEYTQAVQRSLDVNRNVPRGIYHLLAPATIDVTILNVLKKRGNLADTLIHSPRSLLTDVWPVD